LHSAPPADGGEPTSDERTMAMLAHLLAIFTWFIGPLVIWLIKKDTSAFVDDQGKEALNFQITIGIAYLAAGALTCVTLGIGSPLTMAVYAVNLVFTILATVEANKGVRYRYPFALRLIS
jgi:hypothetical protein